MSKQIGNVLLGGVGGALLAWLALEYRGSEVEEGSESSELLAAPELVSVPEVAAPPIAADDALASEQAPTGSQNPTVEWTSSPDQKEVVTDLPNRPNADSARPAADLLNGSRISCNFGAGTNTGLRFGDMLTVGAGAQWRGDLIVYDLLEPGAGRVRMLGSVGATGSANGEAVVQLLTSGSRVVLFGALPNGVFMVTTIYDDLDNFGRRIAVMSRHNNAFFTYAEQWLGTCE